MINYALIGERLLHTTQRLILETLAEEERPMSPNELHRVLGEPLGNVSYHVNLLAGLNYKSRFIDAPLLEMVDTQPRRGAVEHFYRLTKRARVVK